MATLAALTAAILAASLSTSSSAVIDATSLAHGTGQVDEQALGELPDPPGLLELLEAQTGAETLQGFDTVLLTQINAIFGSESLPVANGSAVQPGIYVTASKQQLLIFDEKVLDLQDGALPPGPASRECKSGCQASLWAAFRKVWLRSLEEAQLYSLEIPLRVLIAAQASLPAKTLVELAYAAAETRPGAPPFFSLLVNGGNAGLRARSFYLLPPGGLRVAPGDRALGLRVSLGAGESYVIDAAHPRFSPTIEGSGWPELAKQLTGIKKRYPNKGAIILDVGEDATVGDVVMAMVAAQEHFPTVVLTHGLPVKWG